MTKGSITMITSIQYIGHALKRLAPPVLIALALFPPGPTRSAARAAAGDPPPTSTGTYQLFLPAVANGAAPDLIFTPDTVDLAPGAQASVKVRVEPAADLRGASFDLPGVQDGVSSSFAAAADGQSGTLTLAASSALGDDDTRMLQVRGTSRDGSSGWVGRLKVKTKPSAGTTTLFVDPIKGKDTNAGTQGKPLRTLAQALSKAKKGDTVQLGPGVYGQTTNGERYTTIHQQVLVPAGVTIAGAPGTGDESSILEGTGEDIALNFAGDATVTNLVVEGFSEGGVANRGRQSLRNLFLHLNNQSLIFQGSAQATLTESAIGLRALGDGVRVAQQAQFIMDGGAILGNIDSATCEISTGLQARDASRVTLKNGAQLLNIRGSALFLNGTPSVTLVGATIKSTLPADCGGDPSVNFDNGSPALTLQNTQIINSGGIQPIGIRLNSNTNAASLTLIGTTISGFKGSVGGTGIELGGTSKLVVSGGSRIKGNTIGIDARGNPNGSVTVADSELSGNNVGIISPVLKLRTSQVIGNGTGIQITGLGGVASADLGQASDPGGNTLAGNTFSGLTFAANVIRGGAFASGNTWNPNTQATGSTGRYAVGFQVTSNRSDALARGKNFFLPAGSNTAIQF
jgi:uncharacterized protein DUF1565